MIFNIECRGGGQWRFLWCIIMRLQKKVKDLLWGDAKKWFIFLSTAGIGWVKSLTAFRWLKPRKPEIGLAPVFPRHDTKHSIPTYPSSIMTSTIIHLYLLVLFRTIHSPEVYSTLVPLSQLSPKIIHLCVFVLPFVICPASEGWQCGWQIYYRSTNLVSKSSDSYSNAWIRASRHITGSLNQS